MNCKTKTAVLNTSYAEFLFLSIACIPIKGSVNFLTRGNSVTSCHFPVHAVVVTSPGKSATRSKEENRLPKSSTNVRRQLAIADSSLYSGGGIDVDSLQENEFKNLNYAKFQSQGKDTFFSFFQTLQDNCFTIYIRFHFLRTGRNSSKELHQPITTNQKQDLPDYQKSLRTSFQVNKLVNSSVFMHGPPPTLLPGI